MDIDELFPTHIRRLVLTNHKCFYSPTEFDFGPGFNLLIGENSSGKSTVLEALDPSISPQPHHSVLNESSRGVRKNEPSMIEINVAIIPAQCALLSQKQEIHVCNRLAIDNRALDWTETAWREHVASLRYLSFDVKRSSNANEQIRLRTPLHECVWQDMTATAQFGCATFSSESMQLQNANIQGDHPQAWRAIRDALAARTYRFLTERRIAPSSGLVDQTLRRMGQISLFA